MIVAAGDVDLARILLDLLIVVVAAKVAAEVAERVRLPAVLGEIVAGVAIGPSGFGLIRLDGDRSTALALLAELGVLLLLVGVGLEMDLAELGRVGRQAMAVAVTGVIVPFAAGTAVGVAMFDDVAVAVFVGAALTATSVGITARVFGDLRALASVEARIVLGAAVADDVIGLVILTVVTKVVVGGVVTAGVVLSTVGLAAAFLVGTAAVGIGAVPRVFRWVGRRSTAPSTPVTAALALMLAFAALAGQAKLAFIIGAFMAGLALRRTDHHERVAAELNSLGTILVPVFFASIGLHTDLAAMARPRVLGVAAALAAVAVLGKVAAGWAVRGRAADRLLIGLGMIPRGEVGLIFASIGLASGVLDGDQYGALVVVVLVTTVVTPPLLRRRVGAGLPAAGPADDAPSRWNPADTSELIALLRTATPRTWRLLESTGVLDRALPELAEVMRRRRAAMSDLAPLGSGHVAVVDRLLRLPAEEADLATAPITDTLIVAALVDGVADGPTEERMIASRLVGEGAASGVLAIVEDARLLRGRAGMQVSALDETEVIQLAVHLRTRARCRDAYLLALAGAGLGWAHRASLDALYALVDSALAHPDFAGGDAAALAGARLQGALALVDDPHVAERLAHTPRIHLLATEPGDLARQAALIEPLPPQGVVRVAVMGDTSVAGRWIVEVACRDSPGLLARLADVLLADGLEVVAADIATWPDGGVVDRFTVRAAAEPDATALAVAFRRRLTARLHAIDLPGAMLTFDAHALPWHTSCVIEGPARMAAFRASAHAFAVAGVSVHAARLDAGDERFTFRFWLMDRSGRKLTPADEARVRRALSAR